MAASSFVYSTAITTNTVTSPEANVYRERRLSCRDQQDIAASAHLSYLTATDGS
jgi:hypothetical protein